MTPQNIQHESWFPDDNGVLHVNGAVLLNRATYEYYREMENRIHMKLEQLKGDDRPAAEFYRRALTFALGEGYIVNETNLDPQL